MDQKIADKNLVSLVEAGVEAVIDELAELEKLVLELALSADRLTEEVPVVNCGVEQ